MTDMNNMLENKLTKISLVNYLDGLLIKLCENNHKIG